MSETDIMKSVMKAVSNAGTTCWRNNVGFLKQLDGRFVRFGLCTGSSDIIGITPVLITPEMINTTIGVFTAIEVKTTTGKPTIEQRNFVAFVKQAGGIAGIVRNEAEALALLRKL